MEIRIFHNEAGEYILQIEALDKYGAERLQRVLKGIEKNNPAYYASSLRTSSEEEEPFLLPQNGEKAIIPNGIYEGFTLAEVQLKYGFEGLKTIFDDTYFESYVSPKPVGNDIERIMYISELRVECTLFLLEQKAQGVVMDISKEDLDEMCINAYEDLDAFSSKKTVTELVAEAKEDCKDSTKNNLLAFLRHPKWINKDEFNTNFELFFPKGMPPFEEAVAQLKKRLIRNPKK